MSGKTPGIDISVIIVNWNVKELVLRLIDSIKARTRGVSYEILVTDNASADGSVEAIRAAHPDVTLIANTGNLGFAKAVNQGLALARGRVLLVQNPDSELLSDALTAFVREFDARPELGIIGPRLLNTDLSVQDSVRRFPSVLDQTMLALKLHHPFRKSAPIRRYLADDFDYTKEQEVDQLMGASFAFRRELMDKVGVLDERFFIWYEEVDFMKRAKDAGYSVRFLPSIEVLHHRGQSFGQVFSVQKQKYYSKSMAQYMHKHFGTLTGVWFHALRPVSLFLAWGQNLVVRNKETSMVALRAVEFLAVLEIGSWLMQWNAWLALPLLLAVSLGVFAGTLIYGLGFGLAAIALEVLIGSHGHIITLGTHGSGGMSVRMGMFLAVMGAWGVGEILKVRAGAKRFGFAIIPKRLGLLVIALVYGAAVALMNKVSLGAVFSDANGYVFFALLLPVLSFLREVWGEQDEARRTSIFAAARVIFCVGTAWLALKTLALAYVFSHLSEPTMRAAYVWIRDTRVGEITRFMDPFYRVFLASQLFLGVAVVWGLFARFARRGAGWYAWMALATAGLITSLSRSIALAVVVSVFVTLVVGLVLRRMSVRAVLGVCGRGLLVLVMGVLLLGVVLKFPFPSQRGRIDLSALLRSRYGSAADPAASARWALLPPLWGAIQERPIVGYGFGKELSYFSPDPFWTDIRADGLVTTTRFEWGWLEVWLKFGLVAGAMYAAYFVLLGRAVLRVGKVESADSLAMFAVFIALIATHATTPYLDHPIGIGTLIWLEGWALTKRLN